VTGTADRAGATDRTDRMPPLPEEDLSPQQRHARARITAGPRGGASGPFVVLLRAPELMDRVQRVGEHLRFEKQLEPRLFELAILVVARHRDQGFEWAFHHPIALEAGLDPAVAQAVGEGRRPEGAAAEELLVWDLLDQLHRARAVDDALYARAVETLGEAGVVELVTTAGYYTTLAMLMQVAQTPPPDGARLPRRTGEGTAAEAAR
jgi:4-carboxymuconolactone decarboxylase